MGERLGTSGNAQLISDDDSTEVETEDRRECGGLNTMEEEPECLLCREDGSSPRVRNSFSSFPKDDSRYLGKWSSSSSASLSSVSVIRFAALMSSTGPNV